MKIKCIFLENVISVNKCITLKYLEILYFSLELNGMAAMFSPSQPEMVVGHVTWMQAIEKVWPKNLQTLGVAILQKLVSI